MCVLYVKADCFVGKNGTPQPWYFPISPTYWGCRKRRKKNLAKLNMTAFSNNSYVLDDDKSMFTDCVMYFDF